MGLTFLNTGKAKTIAANGTITAASNAAPISVTSTAHGLETGDIIQVSAVTGNLAANGKFTITKVDANTYTLNNSNGSGAYVSGGSAAHLGFEAKTLFDNTIFPSGITRTAFRTRIDALDAGANLRTEWDDTADAAFVTSQTFWGFDKPGSIVAGLSEANFASINEDYPSLRAAASGNSIRVRHYIGGGVGKKATFTDSVNF